MTASTQTLYEHLNTLTKQWFYDKTEIDTELSDVVRDDDITDVVRTSNTAGLITNTGEIDTTTYLEDTSQSGEKYLIVDDDETGILTLTNGELSYDTSTYLTEHQDISGKANIADLATVATSGSYTDLSDVPETFTPASHTQASSTITDSNTYTHIDNANATQESINSAIDSKLGALLSIELITVVSSKPTASADTMNKLYLVAESSAQSEDAYEIFITVRTGTSPNYSYAWEKVDTARIDLSGYALVDHVHGNITNDGKVGSNANYFVYTTTGGAVDAKQKIGNIDTSGAIGTDSGKVVVTTTSGVVTTSDWVTEVDAVVQDLIAYGNNNS